MARYNKISDEIKLEIINRRILGDLTKQIAYDFGLAITTVSKILKENHLVSRRKIDRAAVKHLLSIGVSHRAIAMYWGCDLSLIYKIGNDKLADNEQHIF